MATPTPELILGIRKTIQKLKNGAPYQWGHMGACNCGNLAQELTKLSKGEIHAYAMQRHGDWNEQLVDYCPTSGYPMDLMVGKMLETGLTLDDLMHLEKLSDPEILFHLPLEKRLNISKNSKTDVILYLETWVKKLEEKWLDAHNSEVSRVTEKINYITVLG
ncbi:MAG TPA: hypothetical protein VK957_13880 [Lunatimonas sp.]|nr:hypothetical protein [Lunatimonas sp.]